MWGRRFEPSALKNVWSMNMIPQKYREFGMYFLKNLSPYM
jgi:hypothetical protein